MAVQPTYPGIYIQEVPSGVNTITGVSTSLTAFIGYTAKGPVNKAIQIFNLGDYERYFGGLHRDSLVSYAVRQFFINKGTEAIIVRVARGATRAEITLKDRPTPSGENVLQVYAANEGNWGNNLRLEVDYNTSNPDSTFNLIVTRNELRNGVIIAVENESFRNLSMNSRSSTYVINVVNSSSKLIQIQRLVSTINFEDRGYSLSGNLSGFVFSSLSAQQTNITGMLDGIDSFNLVLSGPIPDTIESLVNSINNAIVAEGLDARLEAVRAGADGTGTGNHIKLTSLHTTANPNTDNEFSSVTIFRAPTNDLSAVIGLGLRNGGREKEGASTLRPAVNGTLSGDLAEIMDQPVSVDSEDDITITLFDYSSGTADEIISTTVNFSESNDILAARSTLQEAIRTITHLNTANATVELNGTFLRVVPSGNSPYASIQLSGDSAEDLLFSGTSAPSANHNLQQYSVGTGIAALAQIGASPGYDGNLPEGRDIIGNYDAKSGMYALRNVDIFNILSIPDSTLLNDSSANSVIASAIAFCEEMRAFYIIDYDPTRDFTNIKDWVASLGAQKNAAVFFPRIIVADPLDNFRLRDFPNSGTLAGLFARIDTERGVWKAPAGIEAGLNNVQSLKENLTDPENGFLNKDGINCLRTFPGSGRVSWGARTLEGSDLLQSEWKYIPIRRLALFLQESLFRGTKWVVFEPNDEPLWAKIRMNVGAFMTRLFRLGAFQGSTPELAFYVKCDSETTPQADRDLGIVNIEVGFAPLKPAEFVIVRIQQIAGSL